MKEISKQKIRLLILYDILHSRTDENKPMTTQQIIDALREKGFSVGRKTLYEDIETLNEFGYEVLCTKSRSNLYYIVDRKFERSEVQILLNAVNSSVSLTDSKTKALLQKLFGLLSETESEQLQAILSIGRNKRNNEHIYYNIDAITTAIIEKKKLTFLYFDYDENGKREYRKNKERYEVNPLGIVYSNDKIYLVCFHDKYGEPVNYRIDRMDEVQAEDDGITYKEEFENFDINAYKQERFAMYGGEQETVELVYPKDLIEVVTDRFGEGIAPVYMGNGEYTITEKIQVSKVFFAWLTIFEGRVRINAPEKVKKQYAAFIKNISETLKKF